MTIRLLSKEPRDTVLSNRVAMKSSQAGGSSVFMKIRKARYWRLWNILIKTRTKDGRFTKELAILPSIPTTAAIPKVAPTTN